jgi:hypothetical protein
VDFSGTTIGARAITARPKPLDNAPGMEFVPALEAVTVGWTGVVEANRTTYGDGVFGALSFGFNGCCIAAIFWSQYILHCFFNRKPKIFTVRQTKI